MLDASEVSDRWKRLRDGLREAGWLPADLWIASVALGRNLALGDVTSITTGHRDPSPAEYNLLAVALNERFMDLDRDPEDVPLLVEVGW